MMAEQASTSTGNRPTPHRSGTPDTSSAPVALPARQKGMVSRIVRTFQRNPFALVALAGLLMIVLMTVFATQLTPHEPIGRNAEARLLPPSLLHPMGTDSLGRDVMSRVLHGGQVSLQVGFLSIILAVAVSVPLGLVAGYFGGWLDNLIMRAMDMILAFPGLILIIWLVSLLGSSMTNVIMAIAFFSIPTYARLTRGITLSLREMEYVMAARSMGASAARILIFHILPGVVGPVIVVTTLGVSGAIITGASLSFLGLGVRPPTPEWGAMLADGRSYLRNAWWISVFPGMTITLVVLALNIVGDALRDALDPNMSTR